MKVIPLSLKKRPPKERAVYSLAVLTKLILDEDWQLAEVMSINLTDQIIELKNGKPELSVVSESS